MPLLDTVRSLLMMNSAKNSLVAHHYMALIKLGMFALLGGKQK